MKPEEIPKKEWYSNGWGLVAAILLLPFFAIWYIWQKTKWEQKYKWIATVAIGIFVIIILVSGNNSPKNIPDSSHQADTTVKEEAKVAEQPKTESAPVAGEKPKEKTTTDKLWDALDQSVKTRDGYSIDFSSTGVAKLTRSPQDYWDETAVVKGAYHTIVSFGLKAFDIPEVNKVEVVLKGSFTDSYGKSNEENAVDLLMEKEEFAKYDWKNLVGQNIYTQMMLSCSIHDINMGIMKNMKTDKLTLTGF